MAERDGEHASLFASLIVRLAGDGSVPQLGGMFSLCLGGWFQDSYFLFHLGLNEYISDMQKNISNSILYLLYSYTELSLIF